MSRPGWIPYYLNIAEAVAERADCRRRKVGAVITVGNRIAVCGYNGTLPGVEGCLDGKCPRGLQDYDSIEARSSYNTGPGFCIAVHAEQNALLDAAKRGVAVTKGTLYVTCEPCTGCYKMIAGAGLLKVVYPYEKSYRSLTYPFLSCYLPGYQVQDR